MKVNKGQDTLVSQTCPKKKMIMSRAVSYIYHMMGKSGGGRMDVSAVANKLVLYCTVQYLRLCIRGCHTTYNLQGTSSTSTRAGDLELDS